MLAGGACCGSDDTPVIPDAEGGRLGGTLVCDTGCEGICGPGFIPYEYTTSNWTTSHESGNTIAVRIGKTDEILTDILADVFNFLQKEIWPKIHND